MPGSPSCAQSGADEVVNYRTGDFVAAVKEMTDGKGADVIYDPVGGEVLEKSVRAAAYGARLLVVGFTSGGPSKLMSNHILIKGLSVLGVRAGETHRCACRPNSAATMSRNCRGLPRSASCGRTSRIASRWSGGRCLPRPDRPQGRRQGRDRDELRDAASAS